MLLNIKTFLIRYRKPVVITLSVIALNLAWGFDPKFTVINVIWLLV